MDVFGILGFVFGLLGFSLGLMGIIFAWYALSQISELRKEAEKSRQTP
jgi:hypothetical protein